MTESADLDAVRRLWATIASFDDLFRRDAGHELGPLFADDAQLLWPEEAPIVGPAEIGAAFADFAHAFETIAFEPRYDLVEAKPPLAVVVGTFTETRRDRASGDVERVHGRVAYVWRDEPGHGWRCTRLMTSRYAATERLDA